MKRFLALMLVCVLVLGLIPTGFAAQRQDDATPLTEADYVTADLMWDALTEKEALMLSKRAPVSKLVDALIETVTSSPYYEEDSLIRNGDHFFWETKDGIACGYSPRLSALGRNAQADPNGTGQTVLTASYETKGGTPGAKDVYLIQPYFGLDADFTTQYVEESESIAKVLRGTATTYRTDAATVDSIADALEKGAVVIFDSHGDTDFANPDDYDDYATRANTSYICLQSGEGLTKKDMESATGTFGEYYHAYYAGSYSDMKFYCVNGTAIANHMDKTAPNSILWMALCLSMTTDGLHAPLRAKGVEVAYGYSQSVTFDYDYAWEEIFWGQMFMGNTVADSISAMKDQAGPWDWCHASDYDTIEEARYWYCAFPIVVSSEDKYPGHGKVDDYQNVRSAWKLFSHCPHQEVYEVPGNPPTCTEVGYPSYYECNVCEEMFLDAELTTPVTMDEILLPPLGHEYGAEGSVVPPDCTNNGCTVYTCTCCGASYAQDLVPPAGHSYTATVTLPTCTAQGYTDFTCTVCGDHYVGDITLPAGHSYAEGTCTACGESDPATLPQNPFTDVKEGDYFYIPVLWAVDRGITTGTSKTTFGPERPCTRAQVVTFLWRACGSPEPENGNNPFTDVAEGTYYYKAVLWAVEQGITTGTSKTTFGPDKTCTRGQVATFLYRAQGEPQITDSNNPFGDVAEGAYYYNAVLWAVENNITQGTGKGKFSPDRDCTRGQIVTFLYRALG